MTNQRWLVPRSTPTLGLGLVFLYDVMSLVTILATKTTLCQQKLLIQQKYATLWPDADRIWTLTSIWFLSCGSGAHFNRCAYNIDLTQYWILEYTFSRWTSNSCAVSAKTCWVSKNTRWWLSKIYRVSKNLLSQQKSADSAKNMLPQEKFEESAKWSDLAKIRCVSKNLLTGKCLVITQQNMLSKNLLSQQKSTDWRRDLSRSTTTYFGTTSSNVYCVCGLWLALYIWFLSCVIIPPSCLRHRFNAALLSRVYVTVAGTHDVMNSHCNAP